MKRTKGTAGLEELRAVPGRLPVSVVITTYNEEVNIAECLESVMWADEILVVDSFSSDRTVEVAKSFPVDVQQREYFGSAAQKNWSLDQIKNDWVLILDADERVPESLAAEILVMMQSEPRCPGYYIRRQNVVIDRVIRHSGWSTDRVIRLFHRGRGRYPNRRVHADVEINGPTEILKNPLVHYTFRSFDQYLEKFLNYAEWGAAQGFREGRKAGFAEIGIRPMWRFFRTYVMQLGFLDGLHGLVVCGIQAFGAFLKYARLWEYGVRSRLGQEIDLPAFDDDERTWAPHLDSDVQE